MEGSTVDVAARAVPLVQMRNIDKSFPGVRALSQAQFELMPGEVHALMGENGAGTSTLMKVKMVNMIMMAFVMMAIMMMHGGW